MGPDPSGFYAATRRKADNAGEPFEPMLSATTKSLGQTVEKDHDGHGNGPGTTVS
jgi:hypothetical protein